MNESEQCYLGDVLPTRDAVKWFETDSHCSHLLFLKEKKEKKERKKPRKI